MSNVNIESYVSTLLERIGASSSSIKSSESSKSVIVDGCLYDICNLSVSKVLCDILLPAFEVSVGLYGDALISDLVNVTSSMQLSNLEYTDQKYKLNRTKSFTGFAFKQFSSLMSKYASGRGIILVWR